MNFRPHLAALVMAGAKTQTRRLVSDNPRSPWWREKCAYHVGRSVAVCPGRGRHAIGRIEITGVERVPLSTITHADALAEGFSGVQDFIEGWVRINGSFDPEALVWSLTFRPSTTSQETSQ